MPYTIASATKRNFRNALSFQCGDDCPITATSAGNAGGTTAVFSGLIGRPVSSIENRYLLLNSGTNAGEWRPITTFAPASGTITVSKAFGAQVASAVTAELHVIPPHLFSKAGNEAIYKAGTAVYRQVEGHILPDSVDDWYAMPRGMRTVQQILRTGSSVVKDLFDRADSTTNPGTGWVETAGNWGVISERLYAQSDADADFLTRDVALKDGYIRATLRSDTTASHYRCPALAFRIREDYAGTVDTTACLLVRLLNGEVDLRKNDAGTETSLATSTQTVTEAVDYLVEILYVGSRIRVWLDGVEVISYQLLGTDLKYTQYPQVGIRWDKAGTPTVTARVDDYYAYNLAYTLPFTDWEQQADSLSIRIPAQGNKYPLSGELLLVQGMGVLTEMAADTTYDTIASDTAAVMEIQTTDPAWQKLIAHAKAILYEHASQPGNTADATERGEYREMAAAARAALKDTERLAMPQVGVQFKYPQ